MMKLLFMACIIVSIVRGAAFGDADIPLPVVQVFNKANDSRVCLSELMTGEILHRAQIYWNSIQDRASYKALKLRVDTAIKKQRCSAVRLKKWKALDAHVNSLLLKTMITETVPLNESERCYYPDRREYLKFIRKPVSEGLSEAQEKALKAGKLAWVYYQQECFNKDSQVWNILNIDYDSEVPQIADAVYDVVHASIKQSLKELDSIQRASLLGQFLAELDCRSLITPTLMQKAQQHREALLKNLDLSRKLAAAISASNTTHQRNLRQRSSKDARAKIWHAYYDAYIRCVATSLQEEVSEPLRSFDLPQLITAHADRQPSQELLDSLSVGFLAYILDMQQQQYSIDPQSLGRFLKKINSKPKDLQELPFRLIIPKAERSSWLLERLKKQVQKIPSDVQESPIGRFYHSWLESGDLQELCNDLEVARIALRYFIAGQRSADVQTVRAEGGMHLPSFVSLCFDEAIREMQKDLPEINNFGSSLKFMINHNSETDIDARAELYLKAGLLSRAMAASAGSKEMMEMWELKRSVKRFRVNRSVTTPSGAIECRTS